MVDGPDGTSAPLTVTEAASVFEGFLSDPENKKADATETPSETPETELTPATEGDETEQTPPEGESDPEEETGDEPVVQPPRMHKVKVAGEEREVTEEELLKGYSRTEDYTLKTQTLAAERKAVAEQGQAARVQHAEYATYITQLKQALEHATPAEPDWDTLAKEDPTRYTATRQAWDEHTKRTNAVKAEEQKAYEAVEADRKQQHGTYLEEQQTKLLAAIPDWTQADVQTREKTELVKYAKSVGFDDNDLRAVTDHRLVLMLREAMLYRKSQAAKPVIQKKIADATVVTAPKAGEKGKTKLSAADEAMKRSAKTGSIRDAAAAMEYLI